MGKIICQTTNTSYSQEYTSGTDSWGFQDTRGNIGQTEDKGQEPLVPRLRTETVQMEKVLQYIQFSIMKEHTKESESYFDNCKHMRLHTQWDSKHKNNDSS